MSGQDESYEDRLRRMSFGYDYKHSQPDTSVRALMATVSLERAADQLTRAAEALHATAARPTSTKWTDLESGLYTFAAALRRQSEEIHELGIDRASRERDGA